MPNYFSKNLKFLREKKNLDQQVVADSLNVPQSTLSCWENGIRTPKVEQIIDIAKYFNVDMNIVSVDYSLGQEKNTNTRIADILYSKVKDLPEEKQQLILNVTETIMKDMDEQLDNK